MVEDRIYVAWGDVSGEGKEEEVVGYATSEEGAQELLRDSWSGWIDTMTIQELLEFLGDLDEDAMKEAEEIYESQGRGGLIDYLNEFWKG